jgi:uncharacterized protein YegL
MANLNTNWINLVFVIDKSGSMMTSESDVIGGFKSTIEEQKAVKDGKVTVSLYTFDTTVHEHYVGKDINDIPEFVYHADGMTAMNDGLGMAITNVGKWLYEKDKNGEEMPGKTMVVVMTDGMENNSKEYTLTQVRDMIKEQTDKYNWTFIYQGTDITTTKAADDLGFKFKAYNTRADFADNYKMINCATAAYRSMASTGASLEATSLCFDSVLKEEADKSIKKFEKKRGIKMTSD